MTHRQWQNTNAKQKEDSCNVVRLYDELTSLYFLARDPPPSYVYYTPYRIKCYYIPYI